MTVDKKYRHSFVSVLIALTGATLAFLFLFPSAHSLSEYIGVFIFYLFSMFLGLLGGMSLVVIRTTKQETVRSSFIYNFIGTLNLSNGISGLIAATIGDGSGFGVMLTLVILSFLLGILIYNDIYSKEESGSH